MKSTKNNSKNKDLILTILIAVITFSAGFALAYSIYASEDSHEDMHTMTSHSHSDSAKYEVSADSAPTVSIDVAEDAISGWNVRIDTTGFVFTPQNVNQANVAGQGHAHLYVDGGKVARLYGNYYHYPEGFDGEKTFMVTLNANDHSEYAVDGVSITATKTITHSHN